MIIPPDAKHVAILLLSMIPDKTEEQRRFIGTLRRAMGLTTNNEKRKQQRPHA